MQRRELLKTGLALASVPLTASLGWAAAPDASQPFDFAWLKGQARWLSAQPHRPYNETLPPVLAKLDYDGYQGIRYRPEQALWAGDDLHFRVQFFHRGFRLRRQVRVNEVINGQARPVAYDQKMFDMQRAGITQKLPKDLGFAGFRLHFHTRWDDDSVVFLDSSYFRLKAPGNRQFGISARGLAIDTGLDKPEEFPVFTEFWLQKPEKTSDTISVYALLESPSIVGAYRFDITPGGLLVANVDTALYPRRAIERLGVAPLTSMYLYGENDHRMANDWRPEVHDSDGLQLHTGSGQWIWRPLVNPLGVRVNSFLDDNPGGFGLIQRDRNFDHYQDDGVYYDSRPSIWVEPKGHNGGGWGKGAVQLVELNAPDETYDNIVAYWNPAEPVQAGAELLYSYRINCGMQLPFGPSLAQTVATRAGRGGIIGQERQYFSWRFAVDFAGGVLDALTNQSPVKPVITASRGRIEIAAARKQFELNGFRATFDLVPDDSPEPINITMYLELDGQPLTETWLYQWTPQAVGAKA